MEPTERAKFKRANLETIVSFGGDNFLDIVCRDTVSGHDIRKAKRFESKIGIRCPNQIVLYIIIHYCTVGGCSLFPSSMSS